MARSSPVIPPHSGSRYDELVARDVIRPAVRGLTAGDWREFTRIKVPADVDPLALLLKMRAQER